MINTALEAGIDVSTTAFDPLAKLAKDIAAGAVLIATVNAVAVGYLVFSEQIGDRSSRVLALLNDTTSSWLRFITRRVLHAGSSPSQR
jgi:diacylglycerol kinase (ATP)